MKTRLVVKSGLKARYVAAALVAFAGTAAVAQNEGPMGPFQPWVGEMGISETVAQIMVRDSQTPTRRFITEADEATWPNRAKLPQNPAAMYVPQWPWNSSARNAPTVIERVWNPLAGGGAADNPQTLGLNQNASTLADAGFIPPDSMGAVGPTQVLVCVNGRIRVYDKVTGALGALNTTTNTFFTSVRNASTTSDPQVRFDRLTNKWYVLMINTTTPNRVLLAVSDGPTITASTVWHFFFFQQDLVAPTGNSAQLADYPSLGIDANALYTGANMFTSTFQGCSLWVIQKASVQGAGPIVVTAIRGVTPATGNGMFAPRGVDNPDPAATVGYYIGVDHGSLGSLIMRRITNPGGSPSISANISVTGVPATAAPIANPPASGSSPGPDALDDRLFAAQLHRDRTTGQDFLWSAHNIQVNSAGVASASGGRDACRWYQIQNVGTTPSMVQAGTLFDAAASGPISYWTCSAMATGQGHMAIGCSNAAATSFISCSTAGRLRTDPLGSIQSPTTVAAGAGAYQVLGGGRQRWGDYAFTSVDPNDDQTMWTVTEFANATNSYAVRMTKLLAPPPVTPSSCSPSTLSQGDAAVDVLVGGVSVNGSAFYDTDVTYANRLAASVSGTGVTVNSVTFNHAAIAQFTMNVTVAPDATTGPRTVTVTNPDGQTIASASGVLTINASGAVCPQFATNPGDATACDQTGPVSFTVAATGTPAPTLQWRKDTVPIGGATSATYTINTVTTADAGSYDCIATNACGSAPSNAATLTVNTGPSFSTQPSGQTVSDGSPVTFTVLAGGSPAPTYQWRKNTVDISGAVGVSFTIGSSVLADAGTYDCVATNSCGSATSDPAVLVISCYANCDGSSTAPILNANDFQCFLNAFAAGDPFANCDGSSTEPILNANDFQCFLNQFAAGCP